MLVQEAIDNFNIIKPYIVEILENTKYIIYRFLHSTHDKMLSD